jgi:formylmethanofuran dehydrogenase subunit E
MIREVAFVGRSNSGKTTLLEALVRELAGRGTRVTVVKHTHHPIDWDTPGKDSWRFREAGAVAVVLRTPDWNFVESRRSADLDRVALAFARPDLIIHEGDRASNVGKVIVGESVDEARVKGTRGPIIAAIGVEPASDIPWFDHEDVRGLAAFLMQPDEGPSFEALLERSVAAHGHLCPGQVLGVRVSMRGLRELGLPVPPPAKRLIAVIETDRCAADAVASVTGCSLGKRSLKFRDFGKMAATFLDLQSGRAVRVAVRDDSRDVAGAYATEGEDSHAAQTRAYCRMPDEALLSVTEVRVSIPESDMPGRPRNRVACSICREHVSDDRHLVVEGSVLCRGCAGEAYYEVVETAVVS